MLLCNSLSLKHTFVVTPFFDMKLESRYKFEVINNVSDADFSFYRLSGTVFRLRCKKLMWWIRLHFNILLWAFTTFMHCNLLCHVINEILIVYLSNLRIKTLLGLFMVLDYWNNVGNVYIFLLFEQYVTCDHFVHTFLILATKFKIL